MEAKLNPQEPLLDFLKATVTHCYMPDGNEWYYCPFWFRKSPQGELFMVRFKDLPATVKVEIESHRDLFAD